MRGRRWPRARTSAPSAPTARASRSELYAAEAARLLESGARLPLLVHAAGARRRSPGSRRRDQEAPRYNGRCLRLTDAERAQFEAEGRQPAIRFKVPPEMVRFDDLIRGEVEFDNACSATSSSCGQTACRSTTSWW